MTRAQLQRQLVIQAKTLNALPPTDPRAAMVKQQIIKIKEILDKDKNKKEATKTVISGSVTSASASSSRMEMAKLQATIKALQNKIKNERDPLQKVRLQRLLTAAAQQLRQLVLQAKASKLAASAKTLPAGYIRLSRADAAPRKKSVIAQIKAYQQAILKLKLALQKSQGGGQSSEVMEQRLKTLLGQYTLLAKRYRALQNGLDIPTPRTVIGGQPRRPILLPRQYNIPGRVTITTLISMIAARLPPRDGESRLHYLARLRAYVKRALARYIVHRTNEGLDEAVSTDAALNEALIEDGPAIESEVDAGGIAQDPSADAMDAYLTSYDSEFQNAMEQSNPEAAANMSQAEFSSDGDYDVALSSDSSTEDGSEYYADSIVSESDEALDAEIASILAQEQPPPSLSLAAKAGIAVGGILLALAAFAG